MMGKTLYLFSFVERKGQRGAQCTKCWQSNVINPKRSKVDSYYFSNHFAILTKEFPKIDHLSPSRDTNGPYIIDIIGWVLNPFNHIPLPQTNGLISPLQAFGSLKFSLTERFSFVL